MEISRLSHARLLSRFTRSSEKWRSTGRIDVYSLLTACASGEFSIKPITLFSGGISKVSKSLYFDILLSLAQSQAIKYSGLSLKNYAKKIKDCALIFHC